MTELPILNIFPVDGFDEEGYREALCNSQREREEYLEDKIKFEEEFGRHYPNDALWDDDDEYFRYVRPVRENLGINVDALESLLAAIGAEGKHPAVATALYRAGIVSPGAPAENLYGPPRIDFLQADVWYPHLFAAYLQNQRKDLLVATEPDALVLIQGRNRKPYRGYESVVVDVWLNRNKQAEGTPNASIIGKEVLKRVVTSELELYDLSLPLIEPDTNVLVLDDTERIYVDSEWTSISGIGIRPGEFLFDPTDDKYCQWDRLRNFDEKEMDTYEEAELIRSYKDLYSELDLDVEHLDIEDGEHYDFELNPEQIKALNKQLPAVKDGLITGLTLNREDRPPGSWYGNDYYVNNWGDMTIRVNIERGSTTTTYTLVVFMDPRSPKEYTHLDKYHTQTRRYATTLQSEAAHLLASSERDELENEVGLNEIDEAEYGEVVRLIKAIKTVSASEYQ